jgi:hypothetical protein
MAELGAQPDSRASAVSARAAALGAACLGVFLLAMTAGVVAAPFSGPLVLAILIKAFVVLVMGGIGAASVVLAWKSAVGATAPVLAVPNALRAICPACGEGIAANASCLRCGHPLLGIEDRWQTNEKTSLTAIAFMAVLGAGLSALGLFVGLGPIVDAVPLFAVVGYIALGLLLLAVGVMFVYGAVLMLRDALVGRATWTYAWSAKTHGQSVHVSATAKLEAGRIVRIAGERDELCVPELSSAARTSDSAVRLSPAQRAFVVAALLLHGAGLLAFAARAKETWTGSIGDGDGGGGPSRTQTQALLTVALQGVVPPDLAALYDVFAVRARADIAVAELWRAVRDDAAACEGLMASVAQCEPTREPNRIAAALEAGLGAALARAIAPSLLN